MNMLFKQDVRYIIESLPRDIVVHMKTRKVYLAGGFLRAKIAGETPNDIDLFCVSEADAYAFSRTLASGRAVDTRRTRNAYTVISAPRLPVQFIHCWAYETAESLVQSFDFTVAQCCVWYDQEQAAWLSHAAPTFYRDLAAKRLAYTFPVRNEDAGGSLLRVQKFLSRGYKIAPEEFAKVISRLLSGVHISGVHNSDIWNEGEVGRAKVIAGLLREADPLTMIDGLEMADSSLENPPPSEPVVGIDE